MTTRATVRPVTSRQIKAIVNFLPLLEAINPNDIVRPFRSADGAPLFVLGCVPYHPTVCGFEKACYENGFVQSFDWPAWTPTARRYMRDPKLVGSVQARDVHQAINRAPPL
jgi:hypothetical protein